MDKWLNKKEIEKVLAPYDEKGTQTWVISRIKKLPDEIVKMATRLADLDFINYVRICDETLAASIENYPNRPKAPIQTKYFPQNNRKNGGCKTCIPQEY